MLILKLKYFEKDQGDTNAQANYKGNELGEN